VEIQSPGLLNSAAFMRIAYVITDLHTGGVPLHLLRLATAVRARGCEPHVISLAPLGAVAEALSREGIPALSCDASSAADVAAIWRLAGHLRWLKPDLVHSLLFHANVASRLAVLLAGRSSRTLICEIQTVEVERRWHLTVGGMMHRMSRCVVGNSPSVVAHLERRAHIPPSRLRCIPGGVEIEQIRGAPAADRVSLGLGADSSVILWVGRLDPVKGLDELIPAFGGLGRERDVQLVLVGEGPYEAHVRGLIGDHGVGDRVVMAGRRGDVASILKVADVFVLPSRTEGMPNALLEAMAAERAVVTTDVPGCRDLVAHEVTGLVVPSMNPGALTAALARLLDDGDLRASLARNGRKQVEECYTFDRCVERYISLYRETVA
jgi:glycosyltransferase involved in cell wall biosynthesis